MRSSYELLSIHLVRRSLSRLIWALPFSTHFHSNDVLFEPAERDGSLPKKGRLGPNPAGRRLRDLFSEWCVIRSAPRERSFPDAVEMRTFKKYSLGNVALASNAASPEPIAVLKDRLIVVAQIEPGTSDGSAPSTRHPATLTQQGVDARDLMEWCPVRSLMARRISPCLNLDCDKLSGGLW